MAKATPNSTRPIARSRCSSGTETGFWLAMECASYTGTMTAIAVFLLVLLGQAAPAQTFFSTPLSVEQMAGKQAVIETSMGTVVVSLLPAKAKNHVGFFMKTA